MIAGGIALSAWQAGQSRDATATHWAVLVTVAVAWVGALALGHGRQRRTVRAWFATSTGAVRTWRAQPRAAVVSLVVWAALVLAVVGWDLVSFLHQSHALPTLSYYVGRVTRYPAGRGACFALWLGLGAFLVLGGRRRSDR
jgi:hypothetical protein